MRRSSGSSSALILPLGLPAIASLAIFQFLWVWNDLLVALTFARDTQPITVAIFSQMRQFSANIELIAPAAFISLAIPLVVFFALPALLRRGAPGRLGQVAVRDLPTRFSRVNAVSTSARCVNACGKLPTSLPRSGSYSSAISPRSLPRASSRS